MAKVKSPTVWYSEYYPHYSGITSFCTIKTTMAELKELAQLYSDDTDDSCDKYHAIMERLNKQIKGSIYFLDDALREMPVNLSTLSRCKNKSKGGFVEEGSVAFSLTSAKAAQKACMETEAKAIQDEIDGGWY